MGDQHGVAEAAAIARRGDRQRHPTEVSKALGVLAAEGERHQPGARWQHGVAELPRKLVTETAGSHARNRQPATGGNQCWRGNRSGAGVKNKRSEEHQSELPSLMSLSYADFCLRKRTYDASHTP